MGALVEPLGLGDEGKTLTLNLPIALRALVPHRR